MKPVATNTDLRACLASATVKKRIRMCGNPAVPNTRPSASEISDSGSATSLLGSSIRSPSWCAATAFSNNSSKEKPNLLNARNASKVPPTSSNPALMICTQVVATMPPKVT
ncbi:hypothetical protein D3C84_867470 [compost metagenome]